MILREGIEPLADERHSMVHWNSYAVYIVLWNSYAVAMCNARSRYILFLGIHTLWL